MPGRYLAYSFLPLAGLAALASPAAAALHPLGTITACSTWGNFGCATAEVRRGPLGLQYRTKEGTWVDCASDCRDTLRRNTVDFWSEQED